MKALQDAVTLNTRQCADLPEIPAAKPRLGTLDILGMRRDRWMQSIFPCHRQHIAPKRSTGIDRDMRKGRYCKIRFCHVTPLPAGHQSQSVKPNRQTRRYAPRQPVVRHSWPVSLQRNMTTVVEVAMSSMSAESMRRSAATWSTLRSTNILRMPEGVISRISFNLVSHPNPSRSAGRIFPPFS